MNMSFYIELSSKFYEEIKFFTDNDAIFYPASESYHKYEYSNCFLDFLRLGSNYLSNKKS